MLLNMLIVTLVLFVLWVSPSFSYQCAFPSCRWLRKTSPIDHHQIDNRQVSMLCASAADYDGEIHENCKPHAVVVYWLLMIHLVSTTATGIQIQAMTTSERASEDEAESLYAKVAALCHLPPLDQRSVNVDFAGVSLTSPKGNEAISAFTNPNEFTVSHVPVDMRSYSRNVFLTSLGRPGVKGRRYLLCSAAIPGSGKTVMLWANSYWFVQETKGIAVAITFNDDQAYLWKGQRQVSSYDDMVQGMVARILYRVMV